MAAPQTPQFVLYRTTFLSTSALSKSKGIALSLSGDGAHITSLSVSASTDTEPNTLSISFAVPIDTPREVQYNDVASYLFDFKSNQTAWQVMDQVQLFASPTIISVNETGKDGVTVTKAAERYSRMFMGIVTNITGSWDGSSLNISLTAKDLFYWLSLAKIQQKASIHELLLRGDLEGLAAKEKGVLLAYKSKYEGLYIKDIIRKILCDPGQNEVQGIFLPEMTIPDMLGILGSSNFMDAYKKDAIKQIEQEWTDKQNAQAATYGSTLPDVLTPEEVQKIKEQTQLEGIERPAQVIDELVTRVSVTDSLMDLVTQRQVRQVMAAYWDNEFGRLIRENYMAFRTVTDHKIVPFPIEYQGSSLINGEYRSKLEFLQQLSQLTIYEIFQAPQGYIFVKPPLYNAPPLATISSDEVYSVSHNIDAERILTQVTTQGTLVVGSDNKRHSGMLLNMSPEFPFIQGTYTYLFPKGFKEDVLSSYTTPNNKAPFVNIPRDYNVYKDFQEQWKIIKKKSTKSTFSVTDYPVTADRSYSASASFGAGKDPSIPDEARKQIFVSSVSMILLTNAAKFDIEAQLKQYLSVVSPGNANLTSGSFNPESEQFVQLYAQDLASLVLATLQERGDFSFSSTSSVEATYIRDAVKYYCKKASGILSEGGVTNGSVVPATVAGVTSELIREGITYGSTSASVNQSYNNPVPVPSSALNKRTPYTLSRAGTLTIPRFLFRITFVMDSDIPAARVSELSTGEFNVLQHGLRSRRIDNPLVRDNEGAVLFAKFIMDKNNATVETAEITLKTLRLDIVPGFPIYNEMDACIYYVDGIDYRISAGTNIETSLRLSARRRPVWKKADKAPTQSECSQILKKLQDHEPTPDNVFVGTEVTYKGKALQSNQATNAAESEKTALNTYLVGWEYIGGSVKVSENVSRGGFSPNEMVPSFGAVIDRYKTSNTGDKKEEKTRTVISSPEKTSYHIGFPNEIVTRGYIVAQTAPPPPGQAGNVYYTGVKFFVPLSYMELRGGPSDQVQLPTIRYEGDITPSATPTPANPNPVQPTPSDIPAKIKKIVGAWSSGTNLQWNPVDIKAFTNSELSTFLATARFIMLKRADFTLGSKDFTAVGDTSAVNYYANEYVIADFDYYSADEFEAYLKTLLNTTSVKVVLDGITEQSIPQYVEKYRETLEAFKQEKFNTVVMKS